MPAIPGLQIILAAAFSRAPGGLPAIAAQGSELAPVRAMPARRTTVEISRLLPHSWVAMTWSPVFIAAVFSLAATALAIVLIHNWSRVDPILSRWIWLALALLFSHSAVGSLRTGQTALGLAEAGLAVVLFWPYAARLWKCRRKRLSSPKD